MMAVHSPETDQIIELAGLVAKLEGALLEYVEKFGPTDRAREALRLVAIWHARPEADTAQVNASRPAKTI